MKKTKAYRKYYLHSQDTEDGTGKPIHYFSQHGNRDGWGFWVLNSGAVLTDHVFANGKMPSGSVVKNCVRCVVR